MVIGADRDALAAVGGAAGPQHRGVVGDRVLGDELRRRRGRIEAGALAALGGARARACREERGRRRRAGARRSAARRDSLAGRGRRSRSAMRRRQGFECAFVSLLRPAAGRRPQRRDAKLFQGFPNFSKEIPRKFLGFPNFSKDFQIFSLAVSRKIKGLSVGRAGIAFSPIFASSRPRRAARRYAAERARDLP